MPPTASGPETHGSSVVYCHRDLAWENRRHVLSRWRPITNTNWEGTGVKPDTAVPADAALETAHKLAPEKVGTPRAPR
jgi:hypothetical protein